ncbi:Lactation elevated protein 1 [Hordeum vulgare]|nr:Lactation elevated protein 1 [Hordeum vulgare]
MEWHRLARRFGGAVKSCLADRCYTESCLVGRCYTRRFFKNLRFWTDEHRVVALFGAVVASTDVRTVKDDTDLSPKDGSWCPFTQCSGGSNNVAAEFVKLLATNAVEIDQAPIAGFDYNELEGSVDDHGGEDEVEEEKIAQQRYKDMDASEGKQLKLNHCWEFLKNCDKWALIDSESPPKGGSFTNMDEDEADDGPRNLNKPDGDENTKEKIKREREASILRDKIDCMLQSNEVLLANSLEAKIQLAEKKAQEKQERWTLLKEVEERKARAAENKTMTNLLAEENRIMTLNRNDMDDMYKE